MEKYKELLDKIGEMKVTELGELVKALEEKFGVSAAMPVMAAGAGAGAAEAEEKTAWKVSLKDGGSQKIQVIKVLREVLGIGLKEAKDMTDATPKVVKEGLKKEEAEELKKKLEAAGATVELL
ncbi:MAG TPA: 50S ribosomal protein L7/L12 [Candidatus Paceibacterota bacterium]